MKNIIEERFNTAALTCSVKPAILKIRDVREVMKAMNAQPKKPTASRWGTPASFRYSVWG